MEIVGGKCGNEIRPKAEVREGRDRWDTLGGMLGTCVCERVIEI